LLHYAKHFFAFRDESVVTGTGGKSRALASLRHAIEGLRPHLTTPDQLAALFLIEETTIRLAEPTLSAPVGMMDFDPSRLNHLLEITGPDMAGELLARLSEDLGATESAVIAGAATQDWKALREGSHVLISLSGSVGALSLQAMAESLNAIAHGQDRKALDKLMPTLQSELSSLIRLIRDTRPPNGSAR
jgi:HPt (histidine-containing phosphotransfer) domain-containing protein